MFSMHTFLPSLQKQRRYNLYSGKKICLVGNASSLIGKNLGSLIDSYDIVLRFNFSGIPKNLKGFEEDLGTKITHWVMITNPWAIWPNLSDNFKIEDFEKLENVDCSSLQEIWLRNTNTNKYKKLTLEKLTNVKVIKSLYIRKSIRLHPEWDSRINSNKVSNRVAPSTGILSIFHALNRWKDVLSLAGFGGCSEVLSSHYNRSFGSKWKFHNLHLEQEIINKLEDKGLVKRLDGKGKRFKIF